MTRRTLPPPYKLKLFLLMGILAFGSLAGVGDCECDFDSCTFEATGSAAGQLVSYAITVSPSRVVLVPEQIDSAEVNVVGDAPAPVLPFRVQGSSGLESVDFVGNQLPAQVIFQAEALSDQFPASFRQSFGSSRELVTIVPSTEESEWIEARGTILPVTIVFQNDNPLDEEPELEADPNPQIELRNVSSVGQTFVPIGSFRDSTLGGNRFPGTSAVGFIALVNTGGATLIGRAFLQEDSQIPAGTFFFSQPISTFGSIRSGRVDFDIPANGYVDLLIRVSSEVLGDKRATLVIQSNDPDDARIEVPILVRIAVPG